MTNHTNNMRSNSHLLFGLFIMLAGVFFLLHSLLPDMKTWPFLVIAAGLAVTGINGSHRIRGGERTPTAAQ